MRLLNVLGGHIASSFQNFKPPAQLEPMITYFLDGELFQSSSDRQKSKQAAYEKMRKKKLKKLEIKVKCNNGQEPILILSQQVRPSLLYVSFDH